MAMAIARDLGRLNLEQAARLLEAMAWTQHPLFRRAAVKWVKRYLNEGEEIEFRELYSVVEVITELGDDRESVNCLYHAARNARKIRPQWEHD